MNVLITGVGSGFGEALAKAYLLKGASVYALSSRTNKTLLKDRRMHLYRCNLANLHEIPAALEALHLPSLDMVILNAGVLGEIQEMEKTSVEALKKVMDINVYANKIILDFLKPMHPAQVIAISSGASVNGNFGWSAYSMSKSSLNMLIQLYAQEMPQTHLTSFAPGLISTPMLNGLIKNVDPQRYPSVKKLYDGEKRTADEAAQMLIETSEILTSNKSGLFLDIRQLS